MDKLMMFTNPDQKEAYTSKEQESFELNKSIKMSPIFYKKDD